MTPSSPVRPPPRAGLAGPRWTLLPLPYGQAAERAARGWLGRQLGQKPAALAITRDDRGRPRLDGQPGGFDCNWSHSGERLLVVLGQGQQVGIDLEREHARPRALALSQRFFCAAEADWLAALPAPARDRAFLRLWCAKEAILKAHGYGLAFGLHRLRLAECEGVLQLRDCDSALGAPGDWTLQELSPAPGYLGALAWRAALLSS